MSSIKLNGELFSKRLRIVYNSWNVSVLHVVPSQCLIDHVLCALGRQNAQKEEEYSSIADVDALLLAAGDPAAEDDAIKKGTAFQVSSS